MAGRKQECERAQGGLYAWSSRGEGHERRGLQGQREESGFYSERSEEPPEGLRED